MDLLLIPFLAMVLWNVRFCREGFFEEPLSRKSTGSLRGILAILVALGHLYKDADSGIFHILFSNIGTLCVVVFLFLSGYGLEKSFETKPGYGKTILCRRIPAIGKPFLLLIPVYWMAYTILGRPFTLLQVLQSLINGDPIVRFGWYSLCQILLYLVFFLGTVLLDKRRKAMPWGILVGSVLLMLMMKLLNLPPYWYYSVPAFPLGVFWGAREPELRAGLEKHWLLYLILAFLLFGGGFAGGLLTFHAVFYWIIACALPVVVVLILMKVQFGNPALDFLGGLSLEIYSLHGLFMLLLRGSISSDVLWGAGVLALTVPAAWLLKRCCPPRSAG